MTTHKVTPRCVLVCLLASMTACDSPNRQITSPAPSTSVTPPPPPITQMTLSGRVFEVVPNGRVLAPDIRVHVAVITTSGCAPPCTMMQKATYETTTTGPDGRYHFTKLPPGSAVVRPSSSAHRQICGAFADLTATTELDVEITSIANPQPSPTLPSVKVSGQMYEMTPAGRVGVGGAELYLEWHNDMPFLSVYSDANGHYTACGIPANRQIAFWPFVWHQGFDDPYVWHQFSGDTTLDIELKRR